MRCSAIGTSTMLPAFDFKLGQSLSQSRGDNCRFLVAELLFQALLRPSPGLFRLCFVDVLRLKRQIGHNGDAIPGDLNESCK